MNEDSSTYFICLMTQEEFSQKLKNCKIQKSFKFNQIKLPSKFTASQNQSPENSEEKE